MKDFTGREMAKGAYNDRNSAKGWNVDHILPQSKGIMDFEVIPPLLFLGLYPTSSQTRPKLRQSSDRLEWQPQSS